MTLSRPALGIAVALALACGGAGGPGATVPSALQGDWYGADGQRLVIGAHSLGDWQARGQDLPGTFANDMFLFGEVAFEGRGTEASCSGSLALTEGELQVDLSGACEELDGRWSRAPGGPEKPPAPASSTSKKPAAASATATVATAAAATDECERYVDCVCDIATRIRHRAGERSYQSSCDAARVMVDLGTKQADCREALKQMDPWFDGIELAYGRNGVQVPSHCRVR